MLPCLSAARHGVKHVSTGGHRQSIQSLKTLQCWPGPASLLYLLLPSVFIRLQAANVFPSCHVFPSFMSLHCFIWSALSGIYVFSLGFLSAFDHSCYSPIPHPKTTILIKSAREGEKEGEGQAAQCCCKKVILEKAERRHTTCY